MEKYTHPEVLVSTQWVADHQNSPDIRIVEVDEDIQLYDIGHIPGAIIIDWQTDLQHAVIRDYIGSEDFEDLLSGSGIGRDTTVVFYGDNNNWWACYAFWAFKLFGHEKCAIMNGGRQKWLAENRPTTKEVPSYPETDYKAAPVKQNQIRAFRDDVVAAIKQRIPILDVRSAGEYTGKLLHMENYLQEGALRGGHIPTAIHSEWIDAMNVDGTFKSYDELAEIFLQNLGLNPDKEVIVYCRIGERAALTWFVLTYLLGFKNVRNYDGSWTEWGNLVGAPIEK